MNPIAVVVGLLVGLLIGVASAQFGARYLVLGCAAAAVIAATLTGVLT